MNRILKIIGCLALIGGHGAVLVFLSDRTITIEAAAVLETRCGWFENPTPANAWLVDRDGEWLIGAQGGYQSDGDWPDFKDSQWVKTNINYGHGCACMKVTTDRAQMRILTITSATAKPLSTCRKDKALKGKEPSRN